MAGQQNYDLPPGATIEYMPTQQSQPDTVTADDGSGATYSPEDGLTLTGSVSYTPPTVNQTGPAQPNLDFMGVKTAQSPDQLKEGLGILTGLKASPQVLRDYMTASGYAPDEDTNAVLDNGYYANDPGAITDWVVNQAPPEVSKAEAGWRGVQSGALFGLDDELRAAAGAAGNKIGTALGMNQSDASFGDIYDQLLGRERAAKDEAYRQHPFAYGAGFLPGSLLNAPLLVGKGGQATTLLGRLNQAGMAGAKAGALSGFGNAEGGASDRLIGAAEGAPLGYGAGVATYPIASVVNNVAGRVVNGVRSARSPNSGFDALDWRAPQDVNAMTQRLDEMTQAGVPARLADVVDESGRGVIRDAGGKMTPAREELARHADRVYVDAQDRVAAQARSHISGAPSTARQVGRAIADEQSAMGPQFDAVRNETVPITPGMVDVFRTREGAAALRAAEGLMLPGAERDAVRKLMSAVRAAEKNGTAADQARKLFPQFDSLSPQAQQQMLRQLDIKDPLEGLTMTVDQADKFARAIKYSPNRAPGLNRVAENLSNTVRDEARKASPAYDAALNEFSARARVGDAAAGTGPYGKNTSEFLSSPPDEYARTVQNASTSPSAGGETPTLSEADALRMRARDDIVDRATSGSGSHAMATARNVSRGSAQAQRNEALLGPDKARQLERGMAEEVNRVNNTAYVDPRTGSQTASRGQDAIVDGLIEDLPSMAVGNKWAVARTVGKWLRKGGLRNIDAERLVRNAISEDPADVQAAISYLANKGMQRSRAERVVAGIAANQGARAATHGEKQSETPAPNSVRAIYEQGGRQ